MESVVLLQQPEILDAATTASLAPFDMVIDARSPGEFALDHIPGAVNLPVLDDEERARVGTIYVQQSAFLARKIGAALVARNVAKHLETTLADKPGSFRPLVYCWRGGQRSNAMAIILAQVGWRTAVLRGGYRNYRTQVRAGLYDDALGLKVVLLDGMTGSGKTAVLHRLARLGVQTLDLEGLARHRGSLFGAMPGVEQPSQKMFETLLMAAVDGLDRSRPVVVEAESSKVGMRIVPPALWRDMLAAPRIELLVPFDARAQFLATAYADIVANRARLDQIMRQSAIYPGREVFEKWGALADAGDFSALAAAIVASRYDPAYARSRRTGERPLLASVEAPALDEAGQDAAAHAIRNQLIATFGGV